MIPRDHMALVRVRSSVQVWPVVAILVAISLLAVNSRVSVSAVSSVASFFPSSFELSTAWLGWFGFAAPAVFAVASPIARWVIVRLGAVTAAAAFAAAIAVTSLLRIAAPDAEWLFLSDVSVLLCMGAANVVLPVLVKAEFKIATGVVSALYISLIAGGAALPAFLGTGISASLGWRGSFVVWGGLAVLGAVAWGPVIRARSNRTAAACANPVRDSESGRYQGELRTPRPPVSRRKRWPNMPNSRAGVAICILSVVASLNFYVMFGWLPTLLREVFGLDAVTSGALLGLYSVCQIPASIVLPLLISWRWLGSVGAVVGASLSTLGYIVLSTGVTDIVLTGILAVGIGQLCFPLFLTLIVQRSDDAAVATSLSAWSQTIGFGLAAAGPVAVAAMIAGGTGWTPVLLGLAAISSTGILAGLIVGRKTTLGESLAPLSRENE